VAGLFHTLGIGEQSLYVTRQGVDTAGHNIANAQVEGYSRQRVNVNARQPILKGGNLIGNGAYVDSIKRAHDQWTENQINRANQQSGFTAARLDALRAIENVFSPELDAGIAEEMTDFFNGLQELANIPDDLTARTNVREAATSLTAAFRRVDGDLRRNQQDLNERINQECYDLSSKLESIARLNVKIREAETLPGAFENDMRDERDRLLRDVTTKIDITYYEDQHNMVSVRGPKNTTLVDGGNAARVEGVTDTTREGLSKIQIVDWEGSSRRDVTDATGAGGISALLEVRDKVVPNLIEKNNQIAASLIDSVNAALVTGFGIKDYQEATGRNFFKPVTDKSIAARDFSIDDAIINSTDAIAAASSPMAPGDNVIVNEMIKLKDAKLLENGNATLHGYYANVIGVLATEVVRADHMKNADEVVLSDLKNQRESVSGVSMDEEAANLMRWQANFTASSKLITTVDQMLETVLSLKR